MPRGIVVHVIAPSPAGGAESVVVALASADPARIHVVILNQVAGLHDPPHPLAAALTRQQVSVHEVRCGRRHYAAEAEAVGRYLKNVRAALVHTHGYHGTLVGYRAARRTGLPVVATVHGYLTRSAKERLYNALDRWVLRRFDAVIAVSPGIRDQLVRSGVPSTRVHYVQNGLASRPAPMDRGSLRRALGISESAKVVAWIGRLSPEKGPDLFVRAIAGVADATGFLIGDGPERQALDALVSSLGVQNRVILAGFRADAAQFLPAVDVLALTSRMEGTPMVILEAVAAGVPIVAFSVGGIPDLLGAESAWLVPREDVTSLTNALREAITRPVEAESRARAARQALEERLSLENWVGRVEAVYDAALKPS